MKRIIEVVSVLVLISLTLAVIGFGYKNFSFAPEEDYYGVYKLDKEIGRNTYIWPETNDNILGTPVLFIDKDMSYIYSYGFSTWEGKLTKTFGGYILEHGPYESIGAKIIVKKDKMILATGNIKQSMNRVKESLGGNIVGDWSMSSLKFRENESLPYKNYNKSAINENYGEVTLTIYEDAHYVYKEKDQMRICVISMNQDDTYKFPREGLGRVENDKLILEIKDKDTLQKSYRTFEKSL